MAVFLPSSAESKRFPARRAEAEMAARRRKGIARLWQDYGLSITLFALFAFAFVGHTISGWMQYSADQASHGDSPTVFGESGYVWYWSEWTLQNWQSEFLELGVIVVLSSVLTHKGSAESKDSDESTEVGRTAAILAGRRIRRAV